jgi:hypothetical protein
MNSYDVKKGRVLAVTGCDVLRYNVGFLEYSVSCEVAVDVVPTSD